MSRRRPTPARALHPALDESRVRRTVAETELIRSMIAALTPLRAAARREYGQDTLPPVHSPEFRSAPPIVQQCVLAAVGMAVAIGDHKGVGLGLASKAEPPQQPTVPPAVKAAVARHLFAVSTEPLSVERPSP